MNLYIERIENVDSTSQKVFIICLLVYMQSSKFFPSFLSNISQLYHVNIGVK